MSGYVMHKKAPYKWPVTLFALALLIAVASEVGFLDWIPRSNAAQSTKALPAPTDLPLPVDNVPDKLDGHHDYPALDIPVPVGTPVYAVVGGTVRKIDQERRCGIGVTVVAGDTEWTYCHLSHRQVNEGEVKPGVQLGLSGRTGRVTGPHLHLQIKRNGDLVCPQPLIQALIGHRPPPAIASLPDSGCIS